MANLINRTRKIVKGQEGATMVEYGLMLALIAIVCIVAVTAIGTNASALFGKVASTL